MGTPFPTPTTLNIKAPKLQQTSEAKASFKEIATSYDKIQKVAQNMEQQTGSKQEKEYVKAVYCHPDYLTNMQSAS